jgi:hypothetical protein
LLQQDGVVGTAREYDRPVGGGRDPQRFLDEQIIPMAHGRFPPTGLPIIAGDRNIAWVVAQIPDGMQRVVNNEQDTIRQVPPKVIDGKRPSDIDGHLLEHLQARRHDGRVQTAIYQLAGQ